MVAQYFGFWKNLRLSKSLYQINVQQLVAHYLVFWQNLRLIKEVYPINIQQIGCTLIGFLAEFKAKENIKFIIPYLILTFASSLRPLIPRSAVTGDLS